MTPTTQAGATSAEETKTPGQIAFEAARPDVRWENLNPYVQDIWDRGAAAVLASRSPSPAVVPESVRLAKWLEVQPIADRLHNRLERSSWGALVPMGVYGLPGTQAHWLRVAAEAIEIVREALIADAPPSGRAAEGWRTKAADEIDIIARQWGADGRAYAKTIAAILRSEEDAPTPPASAGDVERMSRDELEPHINGLADWLVAHGGMGTWAATSSAKALLLRRDSPVRLATAPAAPEPAAGGEKLTEIVRDKAAEIGPIILDMHRTQLGPRIYMASKTAHASRWRALRDRGLPIISTWIDEAGKGETACFTDLWQRCVDEAATATAVIVYREAGEVLKGAFVEVGAALSTGVPVYAVGCDEFSFVHHAGVTRFDSLTEAMHLARTPPATPTRADAEGRR